jgi:hypothetical protein
MVGRLPILSMLVGALAGLGVTVLVTLLWPKDRFRLLRPLVAAGLGIGVTYLVLILA